MLHILSLPLGASGASVSGRVSIVVLSSVIQWFCCPCRMTHSFSFSARAYSVLGCGSTTGTVGLCIGVFRSLLNPQLSITAPDACDLTCAHLISLLPP